MHFEFFYARGGLDLIFFGFLLEERGGKMGDFVFIGMGLIVLIREEEGWVGFPFGEKRGRRGAEEGKV